MTKTKKMKKESEFTPKNVISNNIISAQIQISSVHVGDILECLKIYGRTLDKLAGKIVVPEMTGIRIDSNEDTKIANNLILNKQ